MTAGADSGSQGSCEGLQSSLGCSVDTIQGPTATRDDGADVDDSPRATKMGYDGLRKKEGPSQVHIDALVEVLRSCFEEWLSHTCAGIVDQDINARAKCC